MSAEQNHKFNQLVQNIKSNKIDVMGKKSPVKPPDIDSDQEMSERHKSRRKLIKKIEDPKKKLKESLKYNKSHANEHIKAYQESHKMLAKLDADEMASKFIKE